MKSREEELLEAVQVGIREKDEKISSLLEAMEAAEARVAELAADVVRERDSRMGTEADIDQARGLLELEKRRREQREQE